MFDFLAQFALLSLLLTPARAFWILSHGSLTQDRLDPLVAPGEVAAHVHNVIGASAFGPSVSFQSLTDSDCTTAPVQADKSAYWAPQLYYHNHQDDSYTLVPIDYVQTYYLQRPQSSTPEIKAFPPDFRMLAGALRTSYNASNQEDRAVNFVCLNYESGSSDHTEFPELHCPQNFRAQVVFPSCWDNENLDSDDHKRHVVYPLGSSPDNGDCPESHPVKSGGMRMNQLVTLFHEWIFKTSQFELQSGVKNFVFATGDEIGLTFHADFISGWDVDVLQAAIDQCTGSLFGDVESCPPFVPTIDREKANNCKIPRRVQEDIDGPLSVLPGCNPVPFTGPGAQCEGLVTPGIDGFSDGGTGNTSTPTTTTSDVAVTTTAPPEASSSSDNQITPSPDSTPDPVGSSEVPEESQTSTTPVDATTTTTEGNVLPVVTSSPPIISPTTTTTTQTPKPTKGPSRHHCNKKRNPGLKQHKRRAKRAMEHVAFMKPHYNPIVPF